ncbi:hypothetical protein, partial [Pseudoalteromonas sp. BSi20439]|uniref:hypothetical protein n=1 Tax=Pseudoalteromonas sp. BSi20439 TaxID=420915 RepID=UPI0005663B00
MKKVLITLSMLPILISCGSDLDVVKNGYINNYGTTSIGNALDGWSNCQSSYWDEFITDNGTRIVEFSCEHFTQQCFKKVKNQLYGEAAPTPDHLAIISGTQFFQFTINHDNTFQLDNVQIEYIWKDGKQLTDSQNPIQQLARVYNDLSACNSESALFASQFSSAL